MFWIQKVVADAVLAAKWDMDAFNYEAQGSGKQFPWHLRDVLGVSPAFSRLPKPVAVFL